MTDLTLSIVTPNGEIFHSEIYSVIVPGTDGEFGVLSGHTSLVSSLHRGVIEIIHSDKSKEAIVVDWGYIKVSENNVDILVDGAVSLNLKNKSELNSNIEDAIKLVESVKDSNVSSASIKSKIHSFA